MLLNSKSHSFQVNNFWSQVRNLPDQDRQEYEIRITVGLVFVFVIISPKDRDRAEVLLP